ncbi:MAG: CBS domain-containing protein [Pseudomonadota bacterium]|nr:CBS domain-containing protein [Pseudomonadota bacterium]
MKKINLFPITNVDELVYPDELGSRNLTSPAAEFFTDFRLDDPEVIDDSVSALQARQMMRATHVRTKLVVDDAGHFIGVVGVDDLFDQSILTRAANQGQSRNEVTVADLMTPKRKMTALHLSDVNKCSVGDIIELLTANSRKHCLVLDEDTHQICGVFSASDIGQRLHQSIAIQGPTGLGQALSAMS